jgi:hypothetical protein
MGDIRRYLSVMRPPSSPAAWLRDPLPDTDSARMPAAGLRATPPDGLGDIRPMGRAGLPATVLARLAHAAEHASRDRGQFTTTLKIVRGPGLHGSV